MFRRNKDKLLYRHINRDYDIARNDINDIQETVDNNSIMDIINPAHSSLDMNNNNIDNVNLINGGSFLVNPLSSDLTTNGFKIENGVNDLIDIQNGSTVIQNDGDIIINPLQGNLLIGSNTTNSIDGQNTTSIENVNNISINNNFNMAIGSGEFKCNSRPIINAGNISMTGNIDFQKNNLLNLLTLNNNILVNSENDLPNPITTGNYLIMDNITLTQSYTVQDNVSFYGLGREGKSSLNWNNPSGGVGFNLIISDASVSFNNLKLTNSSSNYDLMDASNTLKDKILTFFNCSITDCGASNVLFIEGFDLVDLNQVLFQYNFPSNNHFTITDGSKLQINSCEFLRQGQRANPIVNWGTASMIKLIGSFGGVNISNNLIHPQVNQTGIEIDNSFSAIESVISSNTFISVGLTITTGTLINYNTSINQYPSLIVNNNSGIINEKAILEGESINNTTYTQTVLNTYVPVDFGSNFNILNQNRFTGTSNPYEYKYIGKQPLKILISVNISATHGTGSNDDILFGVSRNGVVSNAIQTSISSSVLKTFGYTTILDNVLENTVLQFQCQNLTSGSNTQGFLCVSFNGSLIEI